MLVAASGSPIHVEGDERLELGREGKKCNMKFLDAEVKRLLASVSAIVDEVNRRRLRTARLVFREHEHRPADSHGRRRGVFAVQWDARMGSRTTKTARFDGPNTDERAPVFRRPARTTMQKKLVNAIRLKLKLQMERKYA